MNTSRGIQLVLASASPRRRDLLGEHGYDFVVRPADVTEVAPDHLTAAETVLFNARLKADAVALSHPESFVLGVDTLVAYEGHIFGKPRDMADAVAMLGRLNGRVHEVYSGVWLMNRSTGQQRGFVELTRVHFRHLADADLRAYLARINPMDKAGSYAAQDDQGELIESFEGSFSNVIGLPMETLAQVVAEFAIGPHPSDRSDPTDRSDSGPSVT